MSLVFLFTLRFEPVSTAFEAPNSIILVLPGTQQFNSRDIMGTCCEILQGNTAKFYDRAELFLDKQ